jgi:hypothetical protein
MVSCARPDIQEVFECGPRGRLFSCLRGVIYGVTNYSARDANDRTAAINRT